MREIRTSSSMSGRWKRKMACGAEPRRGNPDTRKSRRLNNRATFRLYASDCFIRKALKLPANRFLLKKREARGHVIRQRGGVIERACVQPESLGLVTPGLVNRPLQKPFAE